MLRCSSQKSYQNIVPAWVLSAGSSDSDGFADVDKTARQARTAFLPLQTGRSLTAVHGSKSVGIESVFETASSSSGTLYDIPTHWETVSR
ncbi:hypothetical protein VTN00DRAFT_10164 [Thermoascus crustaceus]|uniref:uncharacterized protein n=1 Tax=Thermoascus crustaceus TaxID=5088 RepID=UPI00374224BE